MVREMILNTRNHWKDFSLEKRQMTFSGGKDLICWFAEGEASDISEPHDDFVKMIYFPIGAVWVSSHDL